MALKEKQAKAKSSHILKVVGVIFLAVLVLLGLICIIWPKLVQSVFGVVGEF